MRIIERRDLDRFGWALSYVENSVGRRPFTDLDVSVPGDDLFAIRVPAATGYNALHEKIRDRPKIPAGEEIVMLWQDGGERAPLESENDLGEALARGGGKLVVFVEYK